MIKRAILDLILKRLYQEKAIIITGSRQVGKTTLLRQLMEDFDPQSVLFLNCDEPDIRISLENVTSTELKALCGNRKLILIDEAQRVDNIGLTLKLMTDNLKGVQIIATGSSAFDLRNRLNEPLTGRKFEYQLYPFSTAELIDHASRIEERRLLEQRLIYGFYPDVVNRPSDADILLRELTNSYLFKDVLAYRGLRRPDELMRLLTALALQVGQEVSYNELAQTLGIDKETVERYLDLLEKVFVIFRLNSFSRNVRNELKKSKKVFFYDNGIRNALINNYAPLELRNDIGSLWENFFISERKKHLDYQGLFSNTSFWRTHSQQEIDYIEERDGMLHAFELKWNANKRSKKPASFAAAYPDHIFEVVTPANYLDFLTDRGVS